MDAAACTLFRAGCHNHDNPGMLSQYLDYQRETMLSKTDGLTRQHLARQHLPSQPALAGLLYHLSLVEEDWMEVPFGTSHLAVLLSHQ